MTVHVNVRMSKIMHTPINVDGRRTYIHDVCQLLNTGSLMIVVLHVNDTVKPKMSKLFYTRTT